jgi:hypothetical protein
MTLLANERCEVHMDACIYPVVAMCNAKRGVVGVVRRKGAPTSARQGALLFSRPTIQSTRHRRGDSTQAV